MCSIDEEKNDRRGVKKILLNQLKYVELILKDPNDFPIEALDNDPKISQKNKSKRKTKPGDKFKNLNY